MSVRPLTSSNRQPDLRLIADVLSDAWLKSSLELARPPIRYVDDRDRSTRPEDAQRPHGKRVAAHRGELLDVLRHHGVTNPEVFGSTARGDDHEGSDVDILVDFRPGTSTIDIIGIQHELEDLLGVPVDLVPRDGLKERVRLRAAKDLLPCEPLRAGLVTNQVCHRVGVITSRRVQGGRVYVTPIGCRGPARAPRAPSASRRAAR